MWEYMQISPDTTLADAGDRYHDIRLSNYLTLEYAVSEVVRLYVGGYYQPDIQAWRDYRLIANLELIHSSTLGCRSGLKVRHSTIVHLLLLYKH